MKYHANTSITKSKSIKDLNTNTNTIARPAILLLKDTRAGEKKIRLLGVSVSHFPGNDPGVMRYVQLMLPFGE